jgi:tetratricopeptide (TPR) repeat protein
LTAAAFGRPLFLGYSFGPLMHPDPEISPRPAAPAGAWSARLRFAADRTSVAAVLALYALLACTYAVYAPGLSGFFLFDDFPNLTPLYTIKSNPTLDQIIQFFVHGISSPTGRPLSLATFALQAFDWSNNPEAFLRVNLWLHLLNGALLFWALLRVARLLPLSPRAAIWVPLVATALWLAAPIQATAVIYIIQRMTELSATFVFLGLLLYAVGREAQLQRGGTAGLRTMTLAVALCGGLGVLAKENAILLPLLLLITEFTLFAHLPRSATWRRWAAVFLGLPTAIIAAYLVFKAGSYLGVYAIRDFSMAERLMTEARVLFLYLYKALLPWPSAIRLLYDDYPVSQGLWQPWTTATSIAGIVALLAAAVKLRRRAPLFAFGVLWFFGAHLLESTFIPLELVFEHRNYQATAALFFALAGGAHALWQRASSRQFRVVLAAALACYFGLLSAVTWQVTTMFGQPLRMSAWWAQKLPESRRAKIEFLGTLLAFGLYERVEEVANDASAHWPTDPMFNLVLMHFACHHPVAMPPVADTATRIRATRHEIFTVSYLIDTILSLIERGQCKRVDPYTVRYLVEAAFENPLLLTQRRNMLLLYSRALKAEGRRIESLEYFQQAFELQPLVILAMQGSLDELDAGRLDRAWQYLERAKTDPRITPVDRWSHRKDIEAMERLLNMYEQPQP